jgi:hypothetical protein
MIPRVLTFLVFLLFAQIASAACSPVGAISTGQTLSGQLSSTDCKLSDGSSVDVYTLAGTAGQKISLSLTSSAFDAFLLLYDPAGSKIAQDDNSGGGTQARIPASGYFSLPSSGNYQIYVNSARAGETGSYSLSVASDNPSTEVAEVIEFYHAGLDHYFMTADPKEAAGLDANSALGWVRTGNTFKSGGSTPVCRFYGSMSPGPNSHFYTLAGAECDSLKQLQASTPATEKRWNFESLDFYSTPQSSGVCPSETAPVYRAYNNGYARGIDSNHRITSSQTAIQEVVARNWNNEGVVMCAPAGSGNGTSFTLMTNPTDGQILSAKRSDGTTVRYFGRRDAEGIPTSIDNIQVVAADGNTTRIGLDSAKRPARMLSPEGTVFELTYSGSQAAVTATSRDGLTSVSTTFPIGTGTASAYAQALEHFDKRSSHRSGADFFPRVGAAGTNVIGFETSDWVFSVQKCGQGVDNALAWYTISDSNGFPLAQGGEAKNIGNGQYVASIPTNLKPPLDNNLIIKAAEKIDWLFSSDYGICNILGQSAHPKLVLALMCPSITVALTAFTGPGGVAIGSACEVVSSAALLYCATVGLSGPPGSKSLAQTIMDALKSNDILPNVIQLRAGSFTPGIGDDLSVPINVKASGPFPPTTISVMVPVESCVAVVTATAGPNGRISPSKATVDLGKTQSFTVLPNYLYSATVAGCGGKLTGNSYTTGPITADCTVSATFDLSVVVNPSNLNMVGGTTQAFTAKVSGLTNQAVTWSVEEALCGAINSSTGLYTAPLIAGECHVVATSKADSSRFGFATINVSAPATVAITVNPTTVSIAPGATQAFTATVSGTGNKGVTWSVQEGAAGGTVSSSGLYTAPTVKGTYHVVATSQADTSKKAVATITVSRYTKIANNGAELPDSAVLGTRPTDWACTRDNSTGTQGQSTAGLIWEVKTTDSGLRDWKKLYTNYDDPTLMQKSNYVSFDVGYTYDKPTQAEIDADSNSIGFVKAVNKTKLCGLTDWRRPTEVETYGLRDKSYSPTINPSYFPNTPRNMDGPNNYYGLWTSTNVRTESSTPAAQAIIATFFQQGDYSGSAGLRSGFMYVWLVRGR